KGRVGEWAHGPICFRGFCKSHKSSASGATSTSHIFAALKVRQNLGELYCLSPFQVWDQLLVRSQWFRTTLRSVLHHWLPSVAPPAPDSWILQMSFALSGLGSIGGAFPAVPHYAALRASPLATVYRAAGAGLVDSA